jgi:HSP20 family protein
MRRATEEMSRLLESIDATRTGSTGQQLTQGGAGADGGQAIAFIPAIEVQQEQDALVVRADLPGLKADEIDVRVEDGVLILAGERRQEHREEREGTIRTERIYGRFYRAIPLPDEAQEDDVSARFRDGVLEIRIPVSRRNRGRNVQVDS